MKTNDFPRILSDFLLKELPGIRNQSSNTIASYRDTYIRLLTYCRDILDIKPENLNVNDLTAERIAEFLNWLERECNNSISTRNQRLAAIHSLFRYIQMQAPEYMFQCQQVLGIPYKNPQHFVETPSLLNHYPINKYQMTAAILDNGHFFELVVFCDNCFQTRFYFLFCNHILLFSFLIKGSNI